MSEVQVITIPIARLQGNPHQHRRFFDEEKLQELAASLREKGCLENLLVRPNGTPDTFEVVAGERRLRAARIAGLESLPCRVLDVDAAEAYRLSMTENLQRADVSAFEEADGYAVLRDSYRMEVAGIAQAIGKSEGHVRNRLRLCACAAHTRELAVGAWITLGVAEALARARDQGLSIQTRVEDLERIPYLDEEAYDLVICFNYLHRSLMPQMKNWVKPSGMLVYETFIVDQVQFGKPRNPDHLLRHNELLHMFRDFRVLRYREGIIQGKKAIASILAQKV